MRHPLHRPERERQLASCAPCWPLAEAARGRILGKAGEPKAVAHHSPPPGNTLAAWSCLGGMSPLGADAVSACVSDLPDAVRRIRSD